MIRQMKGLLYFYAVDIKHSLIIFWLILLSTTIISIMAAYFWLDETQAIMVFSYSAAIYIYASIYGFFIAKKHIPSSIKLGANRKNIFVSLGIFFLGLAIVKAVILSISHSVIIYLLDVLDIQSYRLLHPALLLEDSLINYLVIDTSMTFFMLVLMYIIGVLFYKYGLLGGGVATGILVTALLFGVAKGWVLDFMIGLYHTIDIYFFVKTLLVGCIIYCLSWLLIRKITVVRMG